MTTMAATNPITDSKFTALKQKLRELFELDKSDLDFGIYRIMAAKNKEVTEFLDRQLRDVVRETLASCCAGAAGRVRVELDEKIASLKEDGLSDKQIDQYPAVQKLRTDLEKAGGASAEELEADIYNHLLAFFSRYYDEGDFISKRRYKGDTYAIPYSGEEVVLHWANKDQYYIKSGEWHRDYRFKIGGDSGKTARIRLLQATQDAGNNKEADDAKRRFILCADNPVNPDDPNELTLHFEFRAPTQTEKDAVADSEATRIFGGKYDKPAGRTKGDEREQFAAYAEQVALDAMSDEWRRLVSLPAPTDAKPKRTILGKHLADFTARNTFDYFIHKDLGGFLCRELNFYIKNEVVRIDDLEALDDDYLSRVKGRIMAIRLVARRIIGFLASIEDFQRRLWVKKKLVLNTNWLVTIDRVPERLRDAVADCEAQWAEWDRLGLKPGDGGDSGLFDGAEWGTRAYLDACDKLVLDTSFYNAEFRSALLASEEVTGGAQTIDAGVTGLLIEGHNAHAVPLLVETFRAAVDQVYIDPPYNTGKDDFVYRDGLRISSWATMVSGLLPQLRSLLTEPGLLLSSIGDHEVSRLRLYADEVFGPANFLAQFVWNNEGNIDNQSKVKKNHEYILAYCKAEKAYPYPEVIAPDIEESSKLYNAQIENSITKNGPANPPSIIELPAGFPAAFKGGRIASRDDAWPHILDEIVVEAGQLASPARVRSGWSSRSLVDAFIDNGCEDIKDAKGLMTKFALTDTGAIYGYKRRERQSHALTVIRGPEDKEDVWTVKRMASVLDHMGLAFRYPKPLGLITYLGQLTNDPRAWHLDCFAGSGTTGHAAIQLCRNLERDSRFILVESASYFETVLKPRIAKALYSSVWAGGLAQVHGDGLSALVKYFSVESYEDALMNLPAPDQELFKDLEDEAKDGLIRYKLDLELGPHLLDLGIFRDPWGYEIEAQLAGNEEVRRQPVDLVETFNYLIGLKVHAYGPIERFSAEFEKARHDDDLGRLKVVGRFRRDPEGPFVFQRVEGVLNDGNYTRVLVIWRTLTDDPEQDAAALDAWIDRHREDTRERSEHRDYHRIYVNGPVTLAQPTQEIRTVLPIEQTFKDRMFADTAPGLGNETV